MVDNPIYSKVDSACRILLPQETLDIIGIGADFKALLYKSDKLEGFIIRKQTGKCVLCDNDKGLLLRVSDGSNDIEICSECKNDKAKLRLVIENGYTYREIPKTRRLVIPSVIRKRLGIRPSDMIKICVADEELILQKTDDR